MNTSEIKYQNLTINDENLKEIRKELYHSEGSGYYVFRNFLPDNFTDHIVEFWCRTIVPKYTTNRYSIKNKSKVIVQIIFHKIKRVIFLITTLIGISRLTK